MKKIKLGLLAVSLCSFIACNETQKDTTQQSDSLSTEMNNGSAATGNDQSGQFGETNGAMGTGTSTGNANGSDNAGNGMGTSAGSTNGQVGSGGSAAIGQGSQSGTSGSKRTGLGATGQYNSNNGTPEPINLDAQKYKNKPPAHTYGDTAPKARPSSR